MPHTIHETAYDANIPDDIVEAALTEYRYSPHASSHEKQAIRRYNHASEHGPVSVATEVTEESVVVTLTVDGHSYTSEFDRCIPEYEDEVAGNATTYDDLRLVAIALKNDYPWADEAFEAVYWADTVHDTELDEDWVVESEWALTMYDAPRGTHEGEEPAPPIVVRVEQLTSTREPNPWEYASLTVPYEDADLARDLLGHACQLESNSCNLRTTTAGREGDE